MFNRLGVNWFSGLQYIIENDDYNWLQTFASGAKTRARVVHLDGTVCIPIIMRQALMSKLSIRHQEAMPTAAPVLSGFVMG